MGLSNTWGVSEGVLPVFMLYAALYLGVMRSGVRSFLKKLGLTGRREAPPGSSSGVCVMEFQPGCREKFNCIFCLRKAKKGEQIAILPCNHAFHKACLDQWLQQHCLCPLCKFSLHQITKSEEPHLSEDLHTLWFSAF